LLETEVIVPTVNPWTEESTSRRGMDIRDCLRATPVPGVTFMVVKPTGSVVAVVCAIEAERTMAEARDAMRDKRRRFILESN
jgi:hypothetical protein